MKRALIFSLEVLLVLLSSAALLSLMQANGNASAHSFAPWRAKLLSEDVAQVLAEKSIEGEIGENYLAGTIAFAKEFASYCVEISYKSLHAASQGTCNPENSVSSARTIFDGASFAQLTAKVSYR